MMRRVIITLLLVLCLTLTFAAPALAGQPDWVPPEAAAEGLGTAGEVSDGQAQAPESIEVPHRVP